jgi:kumamolisin
VHPLTRVRALVVGVCTIGAALAMVATPVNAEPAAPPPSTTSSSSSTTTTSVLPPPSAPSEAPDAPVTATAVNGTEAADDRPLTLTLALAHDEAGLVEHVTGGQPTLTTVELSRRFGASDVTRDAVTGYFAAQSVEVGIDAMGLLATVVTDVARGEAMFSTSVLVPASDPDAIVPAGVPVIPPELEGHVDAVLGFDTVAKASRASARRFATGTEGYSDMNTGTPQGCPEAIASGAFTPNQLRTAYGIEELGDLGLTGEGMRIAVVDFQGWEVADYEAANACFERDAVLPDTHLVAPVTSPLPGGLETTLDLQVIAMTAPGVASIDLFEGGQALADFASLYAAPLDPSRYPDGQLPHVLSSSLGACELAITHDVFAAMESVLTAAAALGVTVLSATGDHGTSGCYEQSVPATWTIASSWYPATSPWVTAVGATNVTLAADNTLLDEVVWNDGVFTPAFAQWGGGGGVSDRVMRPAWQYGPGVDGDRRLVPDIAFFGDLAPGYAIHCDVSGCGAGGWQRVGGTSAATPLFASSLALIMERRIDIGQHGPLGWFNPTLYDIARGHPEVFRDVVVGTNDLFAVGCCTARVGYDPASGWGSANINRLMALLAAVTPRFTG